MLRIYWTVLATLLVFVNGSYSLKASNYRLPNNHIPKSYNLSLVIDPNSDEFSGQVNITFSTKTKSKSINLHASPDFITINEVKVNEIACQVSTVHNDTEIADIKCPNDIDKSENNKIVINFDGGFGDDPNGALFKLNYTHSNSTHYYVATQFSPIFARQAFPCFDEPELKAEFTITIVHPQEYNAVSNTPVSSSSLDKS